MDGYYNSLQYKAIIETNESNNWNFLYTEIFYPEKINKIGQSSLTTAVNRLNGNEKPSAVKTDAPDLVQENEVPDQTKSAKHFASMYFVETSAGNLSLFYFRVL